MLEFICSIPESIGWTIVGFTAAFALMMCIKVIKCIIEMVKDRMEDDEEEMEEMIHDA